MIEQLDGIRETVMFHADSGIRLYHNSESEDYPLHWHTAAEIILPLHNGYTVRVSDVTYTPGPGDILIIPPGELHEIKAPETGERLILQVDVGLLQRLQLLEPALHLMRPAALVSAADKTSIEVDATTPRGLLLQLQGEHLGDAPLREAAAYGLLIQFFVRVGRDLAQQDGRRSAPRDSKRRRQIEIFLRVCRHIDEHCVRELAIDELAELAGYSKFHFARMFKSCIGVSCHDYVTRQRILRAEQLLADPLLPVTEVAMRAGFGSLATFNRAFKHRHRCSPTQYRQLHVTGLR
ncbi:AraC family transcriptional regulator [Paenibacillus sp. 598K]|uniref:helix-turn-helix transcriptional regulator n=1 Tax=Paenibacillus sp. 598K TaxID=1117987 RepID=UPI000FFAA519|nr:AraC family transcriptional regulator [Paenibacillus sp. 598K]GBF76681.1 AraC family transcriptional regulator [Paenibacillus sp. 598K]